MNIMVTGGLGAIGGWVVRQLVEEGCRPVVYENRIDMSLVNDIIDKIDVVQGDIMDFAAVLRVLKQYKVKTVAHMAAVLPEFAMRNPQTGFSINAGGTINMFEAARILDVERVVYCSSKAVIAPISGEYAHPIYKPVAEDCPKEPKGVYGAAKEASELMGKIYNDEFGVECIGLRFATIYSPVTSERHGNIGVIGKMIENAMLAIPTVIAQGGEEKDDVVYIKDLANGIVRACLAKNVKSRLFHIGNGTGYMLSDYAKWIKKIYPGAVISIGPGIINAHGRACIFDISRAKAELGYTPQFNPQAGVKDYIATMKQFGMKPTGKG